MRLFVLKRGLCSISIIGVREHPSKAFLATHVFANVRRIRDMDVNGFPLSVNFNFRALHGWITHARTRVVNHITIQTDPLPDGALRPLWRATAALVRQTALARKRF